MTRKDFFKQIALGAAALIVAPSATLTRKTPVADYVEHVFNSGGTLRGGTYTLERTVHLRGDGMLLDNVFEASSDFHGDAMVRAGEGKGSIINNYLDSRNHVRPTRLTA